MVSAESLALLLYDTPWLTNKLQRTHFLRRLYKVQATSTCDIINSALYLRVPVLEYYILHYIYHMIENRLPHD